MATAPRRAARSPAMKRAEPVPTRERRAANQTPTRTAETALVNKRLAIEYLDINDIVPYEWNPRQNAEAVKSVVASIRLTQGMAMPVVIDANNVLVAGHTRVEACKQLGIDHVPVVRLDHLTPEAINAFRVIDNKVSEQAKWDFDLLAGEIGKLESMGLNWTEFGWNQAEIDCMAQLVASDCLSTDSLAPVAQEAAAQATSQAIRRAPRTARMVLGELVFFVPIEQYNAWVRGLRELHNFNEEDMAEDVKRRLGMLEV